MKRQRTIFNGLNGFLIALGLLILLNLFTSRLDARLDCTNEKRFTLSASTIELLESLDEPVDITIYLSGDIRTEFRKLANSTDDVLTNFKSYAGNRIRFRFENPGAGLSDSAKFALYDSLTMMGIRPTTQKAQTKAGESEGQRQVFPGAIVSYKGMQLGIDLLQGQVQKSIFRSEELLDRQTLNSAEALLEFKFASTIQKLVSLNNDNQPNVGYLIGNGEIPFFALDIYDLSKTLLTQYNLDTINLQNTALISPETFNCLIMMRPVTPLSETDKLKLDQYVLKGGRILVLADMLYAERDSLQTGMMMAYARNLDMNDLLFRWGVRINTDLIADQQCEEIPVEVGNIGGKSQYQLLGWPFFPLFQPGSSHPLVKNQSFVSGSFANSLDTVQAEAGVQKTILLSSSKLSAKKATPAIIDINSIQQIADFNTYNQKNIPVAVLSEGRFRSLFANNLSMAQDSLLKESGSAFVAQSVKPGKVITIADADIAVNQVSDKIGPLPMGTNKLTKISYANHDFIANCIEYLANDKHLLDARAKDYSLQLIDPKRAESQKTTWQLINLAAPILFMIVMAFFLEAFRRKKYGKVSKNS